MMSLSSGRSLLALLIAALAALTAPARAGVIVVDPSGGGDTTDLAAAVAAASSGDILIVMPSDYVVSTLFLDISGKALTIAGGPGGTTKLPPLFLNDVPAGTTFVLRNLSFQPTSLSGLSGATVSIQECAGNVHIEDCTFVGMDGGGAFSLATPGLAGLTLSGNTGAVAIHRSTFVGGLGKSTQGFPFNIQTPSPGGPGIFANGGRLALFDVAATGGKGGDGFLIPASGASGANGVTGTGCELVLSGATVNGGNGGGGTAAGTSGYGVSLTGDGSSLSELDSSYAGGAGAPALNLVGAHVQWPGQAWQLALAGPVPSGESGSIAVSGPPNCLFGLFISASMGYQVIGKFKGPFLPGVPFFGPQFIASTNGSGSFAANFLTPSLVPFGLEGLVHVDQALMVQPGDGLVLGSATSYIQYEP